MMDSKIRMMTSVVGLYTLKKMYPFWIFRLLCIMVAQKFRIFAQY